MAHRLAPGYVGYGDGGQLTEPVRRRRTPSCGSTRSRRRTPEVWNGAAAADGRRALTDGEGRTVDFANTVVVMTSHLGAGAARRGGGFTAGDLEARGAQEQAVERRHHLVVVKPGPRERLDPAARVRIRAAGGEGGRGVVHVTGAATPPTISRALVRLLLLLHAGSASVTMTVLIPRGKRLAVRRR